jgi:hypothetical protein
VIFTRIFLMPSLRYGFRARNKRFSPPKGAQALSYDIKYPECLKTAQYMYIGHCGSDKSEKYGLGAAHISLGLGKIDAVQNSRIQ